MFRRTFPWLLAQREYLGEIRILLQGTVTGRATTTATTATATAATTTTTTAANNNNNNNNFPVKYLGYKSPRQGFQPRNVVVAVAEGEEGERNLRFPVDREGEQWEWAGEPPPGWETGQGIPYNLEQALKEREGRPYGFDEKMWGALKGNFIKHKTKRQQEFPKDFVVFEISIKEQKAARRRKRKERRRNKRIAKRERRRARLKAAAEASVE